MKQIKIFKVPQELEECNRFLEENPPELVTTIVQGGLLGSQALTIINFDDQSYPLGYQQEEIRALILSNKKQRMTSEISLAVMLEDLKGYNAELEALNTVSEENPESTPKAKYDEEKAKTERATQLRESIDKLEKAIVEIKGSIKRFIIKEEALQNYLIEGVSLD